MNKVIGYCRVSTSKQSIDGQELEIHRYANAHGMTITSMQQHTISSRKSDVQRGIRELLDSLGQGDVLIVSELSRIARSLRQLVNITHELVERGVALHAIKERLVLSKEDADPVKQAMIGVLGVIAEFERSIISARTKSGMAVAMENGKSIGRRKGQIQASKLDPRREEIEALLAKGVTKANIARIVGCARQTLHRWLRSRHVKVQPLKEAA